MHLENGGVQRRPVVEHSYKMAIELIQYKRRDAAGLKKIFSHVIKAK